MYIYDGNSLTGVIDGVNTTTPLQGKFKYYVILWTSAVQIAYTILFRENNVSLLCPGVKDRCQIVVVLSICLSVCWSVVLHNL